MGVAQVQTIRELKLTFRPLDARRRTKAQYVAINHYGSPYVLGENGTIYIVQNRTWKRHQTGEMKLGADARARAHGALLLGAITQEQYTAYEAKCRKVEAERKTRQMADQVLDNMKDLGLQLPKPLTVRLNKLLAGLS
jgi:hypothetical protein